ncbi:MAG: ribosome biogenesis GTP-binding protein YihA/YsxC [Verrucomicrobiales bacterium]|jgi:GTP-binding protein|nr:ribosome biogenesis GTP-binding protein YihA/YsxC [Verrucomicrobiales bacterium]
MKITSARFATSFDSVESCPAAVLPEFAFIGRSNVGKSSLINMLCNQAGLAKVSSSPGHTRLINFFVVNEDWCLVDLPGYGYARAPKSERNRFNDFVADYLEFREGLTHVFVLIDSRHDPQKIDIDFVTWLVEKAVPFSLIFTKSDKLKPSKVAANRDLFLTALSEYVDGQPPTFITSVKDKTGRMDVLSAIREMKKA